MNYKLKLITLSVLVVFISCAKKREGEEKTSLLSNLISITDNEDKGVKEVLEYYGGYCEYSIGATASSKDGTSKFFELKMSKSDALEKYSNIIQMPASNIAYLFYSNLKDEKNRYDEIRTIILLKNGKEITFKFPTTQLKKVEKRIPIIKKIVSLIKEKKFQNIGEHLNDQSIIKYDKSQLITNIENIDSKFGQVIDFLPYGFRFDSTNDGHVILHVSGIVKRSIQSHEFSADFDLNSTKEELLKFDYKL